jgi:serine/threonine-protein kinase PpkA
MKDQLFSRLTRRLVVLVCGIGFVSMEWAPAQTAERQTQLVESMKARFDKLHQLRTSQKAGEYFDGTVGPLAPPQAPPGIALDLTEKTILDEENKERAELYAMLAKSLSSKVEEVGVARAALIREMIGTEQPFPFWFQDKTSTGQLVWHGPSIPRFVLTCLGAKLYAENSTTSTVLNSDLGLFTPLTPDEFKNGWYHIKAVGAVANGWIRLEDTLPWNHRLVARYTNAAGRGRVVFFADRNIPESFGKMPGNELETKLKAWRAGPVTPPVIALEPPVSPDQKVKPYLLPILNKGSTIELGGGSALGAEPPPTQDADALEVASAGSSGDGAGDGFEKAKMDIVFVMDTTGSMQPCIDSLLNMAREAATTLSGGQSNDKDRFRFGFWGYQDDLKKNQIEYLTKNFTPQLQNLEAFSATLSGVKANILTADEYPEDVLSGVEDAVMKTQWRGNGAIPVIILCGDAPPLQAGGGGVPSLSRLGVEEVRAHTSERSITLVSFQVRDPKFTQFHKIAEGAFGRLAANKGAASPALFKVDSGDMKLFEQKCLNAMLTIINELKTKAGEAPVAIRDPDQEVITLMKDVMQGAFADFEGQDKPGTVAQIQRAWTLDRDPVGKYPESLEKCVVLSKEELSSLKSALSNLVKEAETAGGSMTAMKDKVASAIINVFSDPAHAPEDMEAALKRLPVKSKIMSLTDERWNAMDAEDRAREKAEWAKRLDYYQVIYDDAKLWFAPQKGSTERWGAIRLEMFP